MTVRKAEKFLELFFVIKAEKAAEQCKALATQYEKTISNLKNSNEQVL